MNKILNNNIEANDFLEISKFKDVQTNIINFVNVFETIDKHIKYTIFYLGINSNILEKIEDIDKFKKILENSKNSLQQYIKIICIPESEKIILIQIPIVDAA